MPKKRSEQQVFEAKSRAKLMELLSDWIVNPLENDFGFDFEVRITEGTNRDTQKVTKISFYIQNKSTIHPQEDHTSVDLKIEDLELYLTQLIPVLLVKYDITNNIFYWEIIQTYIWDILNNENPNWKRQKYKRIRLRKKLGDLSILKKELINAQKRIIRYNYRGLGILEGLTITKKDLSELLNQKERGLLEFKTISLIEAYEFQKRGETEKALEILWEVYKSPKSDEAKIKSIIALIFSLKTNQVDDDIKIIQLADEGISLSIKLNKYHLEKYLSIIKKQVELRFLIEKITQVMLGLKIQDSQKAYLFSYFYNQKLQKLNETYQLIVKELNDELRWLIDREYYLYYIYSLGEIVKLIAYQIMKFAVFDKDIIEIENNERNNLISQCEFLLTVIKDKQIILMLCHSLAFYNYSICNIDKAKGYINDALKIAEEEGDKNFIYGATSFLKHIESKPNPYEIPENKAIDEMNLDEYKKSVHDLIISQGFSLDGNDRITQGIKIGLEDMDPSNFFRFCENLHIGYLNTSPLGLSIGLPSLGTKLIWCKYSSKPLIGISLVMIFNSFKKENCEKCKHRKPRKDDWACTVKWFKEQEKNTDFQKILKKLRK